MSLPAPPPPPGLGGVARIVGDVVGVEPPGVGPTAVEPAGMEVGPTCVEPAGVEAAPVSAVVLGPGAPLLLLMMSATWSLYALPSMAFC